MASPAAGTRLVSKQQSDLQISALKDPGTQAALKTLHTIVSSSFGPWGKLKLLHNNLGGHVVMTSTAGRLLQGLSVSKPIIRLVTTAIQGHITAYGDGGLSAATLALNLIQNALQLDIHQRLIMDVYDILLGKCLDYLTSDACTCKVSLDLGKMSTLLTLTESIIGTKPACSLTEKEVQHLSRINLEAYIKTAHQDPQARTDCRVQFACVEGLPPSQTHILSGVLFETPHIPTYRKRPLELVSMKTGEHAGEVKVVVFNGSLAGDAEEALAVRYDVNEGLDVMEMILGRLRECVDGLVAAGVGIVLCQKVVHPTVKSHLHSLGVLVLDRLGTQYMSSMQVLTGASPLATFQTPPLESSYGWLDDVRHLVIGRRSYLHLTRLSAAVCTVVLCNRTENALDEMKHVSTVAQDTLKMAMYRPEALPGGGCWQTHLSGFVRKISDDNWCRMLGCSKTQLQTVINSFSLSLEQVAMALSDKGHDHMMDPTNHHHWVIPCDWPLEPDRSERRTNHCACGMFKSRNQNLNFHNLGLQSGDSCENAEHRVSNIPGEIKVLDLFVIAENVLKSAVSTANMVLGIAHYVHDTN